MKRDQFLSTDAVVSRLIREWETHGNLIIACDYDNTLFDYHGEGHTYGDVISLLRWCKTIGAHIIIFTARQDHEYDEMKEYMDKNNIPYDSINEDCPGIPFTGRKLYYNILLDDRAGLESAYQALTEAVFSMQTKLIEKENTYDKRN